MKKITVQLMTRLLCYITIHEILSVNINKSDELMFLFDEVIFLSRAATAFFLEKTILISLSVFHY